MILLGKVGEDDDVEFGGEEDGELGGDDAEAEKIRRSNSERASAASATRGVTVTHHRRNEKPRQKRHVDTHGMMDQFVQSVGATDVELSGLIKAATSLPMLAAQAQPIAPVAVESPASKKARSITSLTSIIAGYMKEKANETDPAEIAKLDAKIRNAREERDQLE